MSASPPSAPPAYDVRVAVEEERRVVLDGDVLEEVRRVTRHVPRRVADEARSHRAEVERGEKEGDAANGLGQWRGRSPARAARHGEPNAQRQAHPPRRDHAPIEPDDRRVVAHHVGVRDREVLEANPHSHLVVKHAVERSREHAGDHDLERLAFRLAFGAHGQRRPRDAPATARSRARRAPDRAPRQGCSSPRRPTTRARSGT